MRRDPITLFYGDTFCYYIFISYFLNFKIQIVDPNHSTDFHIKMCLEIKFYNFWKFITIYLEFLKIIFFL